MFSILTEVSSVLKINVRNNSSRIHCEGRDDVAQFLIISLSKFHITIHSLQVNKRKVEQLKMWVIVIWNLFPFLPI